MCGRLSIAWLLLACIAVAVAVRSFGTVIPREALYERSVRFLILHKARFQVRITHHNTKSINPALHYPSCKTSQHNPRQELCPAIKSESAKSILLIPQCIRTVYLTHILAKYHDADAIHVPSTTSRSFWLCSRLWGGSWFQGQVFGIPDISLQRPRSFVGQKDRSRRRFWRS